MALTAATKKICSTEAEYVSLSRELHTGNTDEKCPSGAEGVDFQQVLISRTHSVRRTIQHS